MAGATYEIWLCDPTGRQQKLVDKYVNLRAVRAANDVGVLMLTLPDIYDNYIRLDSIIELWRRPEDGALSLFDAYFVRGWGYGQANGADVTVITGLNGNDLLRRRIVAYDAGGAETLKTDYADDMLKAIARENLGSSATDSDRDWSAAGFSVAPDLSAAPSITMGFAWQNVLAVCQKIANASRGAGTRLYFYVRPVPASGGTISWEFRTAINQPGHDRTGSDQVTFSPEWGNMEDAELIHDHTDEASVIYAGGSGMEDERVVVEVEETVRSGGSPWARVERFYNCSGQAGSDTDAITAAGNAELIASRPRTKVNGILRDGPATRFGLNWNFGDLVMVSKRGRQFEAVIHTVLLSLFGDGSDAVNGRFEIV